MNSCITTLVLALASPAMAFQPSPTTSTRPTTILQNALRDMASYPDGQRQMSEFESFDRNGAFSRSPQGGMGGRPDMMYGEQQGMMGGGGGGGNPNPFSRRGGSGGNDRMYTRDGFDPYSAYGNSFGASQSENRRGGGGYGGFDGGMNMGQQGMMGGGGGGMMGGGGGGGMNGVHADNTLGGFSYSSRVREQNHNGGREYGGGQGYEYEGMGGGFDGPMMGGGMDYEQQGYQQQGGYEQQGYPGQNGGGGGYGGFEGGMDMGRMGP
mmetsp:Transcript_24097/g.43219  ORF Transcript_24097/g.43219 Transcript_24097/m.43219 type:complete len:266 (-) Transcript_24097:267-1064(-)